MTAPAKAAPMREDVTQTYAVALIAEEAAETTQMVGKWLRFGPDHARRDGLTARQGMSMEAGDLLAALDYGIGAGVLDPVAMAQQRYKKFARLIDPTAVDDEGRRLAPEIAHTARPDAGDEDVERVAKAISGHTWAEGTGTDDCGEWEDFTPHVKLIYRDAARAALAAMREGVDRGMVEREAWEAGRDAALAEAAKYARQSAHLVHPLFVPAIEGITSTLPYPAAPEQPR